MVEQIRRWSAVGVVVAGVVATQTMRAETLDRVLAVAGGQVITLSDVTAARDFGLVAPIANADPVRALLSALIDRELVLVEVDRYAPPEPAAELIDRELVAIRGRFPSWEAFQRALAVAGIDEAHVRESVRQNLRISAYQDQRFSPADPRRQTLIDDWIAGLRRRGDVVDLYLAGR